MPIVSALIISTVSLMANKFAVIVVVAEQVAPPLSVTVRLAV
jgi:hypothetical protein